jgi:glutamine synthetase
MLSLIREGCVLYAPNQGSYQRLARQHDSTTIRWEFSVDASDRQVVKSAIRVKNPPNYLEFRLPGADADPYMAMTITVLSLYDGLKKLHNPNDSKKAVPMQVPKSKAEALQLFSQSTRIKTLLNSLDPQDPELGTRYHDAVLKFLSRYDYPIISSETVAANNQPRSR